MRNETEAGEFWGRARSEWSVAIPSSLMLLIVLLSPLIFDILQ